MTLTRRLLSVFMICTMLVTMCTGVFADDGLSHTKLLELDLSDFESGTTAGSGGIVNIGASKTAEITAYTTSSAAISVDTVIGVNGEETPYMRATHSYYNWNKVGVNLFVSDLAWEDKDTTFSFWADLGTENENKGFPARCVADYCVTYNDGTSDTKKSASIYQIDYDDGVAAYRWNFPGYDTNSLVDLSNSREWNHVVITNPRPNGEGKKIMDFYINGVYKHSGTITVPLDADVTSATMYFGRSNASTYAATDTKIGNFEVYSGILSEEDVMNLYAETRGLYGYDAPNSIEEAPEEVDSNAESLTVSLANTIDEKELGTVTLKRKSDGAVIPATIKVEGKDVIVTPDEYLSFNTDYVIDFPALYCGDVEFTTEPSAVSIEGTPSVSNDTLSFSLSGDGAEQSITVLAVGFGEDGLLCGAVSDEFTITDSLEETLSVEGMSGWTKVKFMVWQNGEGYTMPLTEVIEL